MAYQEDDSEAQSYVAAFLDALKGFGWIEGRNLAIRRHWAGSDVAVIARAAKELIPMAPGGNPVLQHADNRRAAS